MMHYTQYVLIVGFDPKNGTGRALAPNRSAWEKFPPFLAGPSERCPLPVAPRPSECITTDAFWLGAEAENITA